MFVYAAGIDANKGVPALHVIRCNPAAHLGLQHAFAGWVEKIDGKLVGKDLTVEFRHGRADVPDKLGEYLLQQGMGQREPWQPLDNRWAP